MLQMIYCFLGVMYNVGSLLALRNGHPAWAIGVNSFGLVLNLAAALGRFVQKQEGT